MSRKTVSQISQHSMWSGISMLTQCNTELCGFGLYKYYGSFYAPQNNIMVYPCFTFFVVEVFIRWAYFRCWGMRVNSRKWHTNSCLPAFADEPRRLRVYTATDSMLFESNDLLYFEILQPKNISYIYKVRPAKDFGGKFVSVTYNLLQSVFLKIISLFQECFISPFTRCNILLFLICFLCCA